MAIYEFLCQECGHQDDLIRKMSDSTLLNCPRCRKESFRKQVSAPNFKLSGSGWYETDFKGKGKSEIKKEPASKLKKEKKND